MREVSRRAVGAGFREPAAVLLVAPAFGIPCLRPSKMLSKVLLEEDTRACACCFPHQLCLNCQECPKAGTRLSQRRPGFPMGLGDVCKSSE